MPQSKYTNADLKRFDRTPGNYTDYGRPKDSGIRKPGPIDLKREPSLDEVLAGAKAALANADRFSASIEPGNGDEIAAREQARLEDESSYLTPILEGLDLASLPASFFPPTAIPAAAYTAARSGQRLAQGTDGALDTGLNVLGLVGGGAAALKGLKALIGAKQAAAAAEAASAAKGAAAGDAAQTRYLARQLDDTGYSKGAVQKITGLGPRSPRTIVKKVTPVSTQGVDVSGLMDEAFPGKYVRGQKPSNPMQGLLDALDSRISGIAPKAAAVDDIPGPVSRGVQPRVERRSPNRYTFDQMRAEAERFGMNVDEYIQSLRQGKDDFVMPSANLPRVR